jgi:transcriptional regulator with XRE-family HTH domain
LIAAKGDDQVMAVSYDLRTDNAPESMWEAIARNVKAVRLSKGYTAQQLSQMCGLCWDYIKGLEGRTRHCRLDTLNLIAEQLQVEVFELLVPVHCSECDSASASITWKCLGCGKERETLRQGLVVDPEEVSFDRFPDKLRVCRLYKGVTIPALSTECGISPSTLGSLEDGTRQTIKPTMRRKLTEALGVDFVAQEACPACGSHIDDWKRQNSNIVDDPSTSGRFNYLANARRKRGMTQVTLVKQSGVSHSTLLAVEGDKKGFSPIVLRRLASALGVDEGAILSSPICYLCGSEKG